MAYVEPCEVIHNTTPVVNNKSGLISANNIYILEITIMKRSFIGLSTVECWMSTTSLNVFGR